MLCVKDLLVAVTVKCEEPAVAPDLFVSERIADPLPGAAIVCKLRLEVTPLGSPVTVSLTASLKPPKGATVNFRVPLALELTLALLALELREKPGTFSVTGCFCVIPPPLPLIVKG